ncbi:MAG: glycosyltransferase [Ignavibacteriaceae bacterium]
MLILIIIVLFLIIYIITVIIFNRGLNKAFNSYSPEADNLKISVVVAAKNEERNIENLIRSFENQEYPQDFFELIIVDDNSKDATLAKAKSLASDKNNIRVFSVNNPNSPPKKGALSIGIENSHHDFIMVTDADCTPLPGWIKSFAGKFRDGYDFLFGLAPFNQRNNSDINSVICFENLRSSLLTFAAAGIGMPFSASARSFGFKKESFNKIQGYKNTLHVTGGDDDLLIQEALKNDMSIGTVTSLKAFVYSDPPFTFKEYRAQKKRHTKTSHSYLLKNKIFVAYWHTLNIIFLSSILFVPFSAFFVLPFILKLITDFVIIKKRQSELAYRFDTYEILILQFIYELLIVFHFINSFTGTSKWK